MSEWISVEDRLPEDSDSVFIVRMDAINDYQFPYEYENAVDKAFWSVGFWYLEDWDEDRYKKTSEVSKEQWRLEDVTHWMPLPDPPINREG